jgi:hypothetical protein
MLTEVFGACLKHGPEAKAWKGPRQVPAIEIGHERAVHGLVPLQR